MIGKVLRGRRVARLIYYLYSPGKHEEHTDPHIVAGWRDPAEIEPPMRPGGHRDFRQLNGLLQQPLAVLGARAPARPVWHCIARAAPTDRLLSDDEWAHIAGEIMHRTGLAPRGQEDDAVRWVAVRHAPDHIHIVATLARQDGARPRLSNDYYKVREACRAVEEHYGLKITAPGDRTAATRPTRAETEKTARRGWPEAPRVILKREVSTAAAAAGSEQEFFGRLRQAGVLVKHRLSTRNPGEITGYAVALPGDSSRADGPVWYGGGKLAADLTLPKLRQRWAGSTGTARTASAKATPQERAAIWNHASQACDRAAGQIRSAAASSNPAAAADAAWAAADTLHAAAAALGSPALRRAAAAYDRAGRLPYGRVPRRTTAGCDLRSAARLLSAAAFTTHDRNLAQAALAVRLAALAEAVADLRTAQRHAAQAAAARSAAEQLQVAWPGLAMVSARPNAQPRATTVSRAGFPATPTPAGPPESTPPARPAPRPPTRRAARRR